MTVVGEAGDIKQNSTDSAVTEQIDEPMSQFKVSLAQFVPPDMLTGSSGSIALRSGLPPQQMTDSPRIVVRSIDPQLPLTHVESMDRIVSEGQASRRFNTHDHLQLCRGSCIAGFAWHLQRHCLFLRSANA